MDGKPPFSTGCPTLADARICAFAVFFDLLVNFAVRLGPSIMTGRAPQAELATAILRSADAGELDKQAGTTYRPTLEASATLTD